MIHVLRCMFVGVLIVGNRAGPSVQIYDRIAVVIKTPVVTENNIFDKDLGMLRLSRWIAGAENGIGKCSMSDAAHQNTHLLLVDDAIVLVPAEPNRHLRQHGSNLAIQLVIDGIFRSNVFKPAKQLVM